MDDARLLLNSYLNTTRPIGGIERLKTKLGWDDARLAAALRALRRSAESWGLVVQAQVADHLRPPRVMSLRVYPKDESGLRYPLLRRRTSAAGKRHRTVKRDETEVLQPAQRGRR